MLSHECHLLFKSTWVSDVVGIHPGDEASVGAVDQFVQARRLATSLWAEEDQNPGIAPRGLPQDLRCPIGRAIIDSQQFPTLICLTGN
jgi:hypothetical protein